MNTTLYIPKKCKVGLQERSDTYTGKLGYVIYHDGKVWRKETSWEGWRHKEGQMTFGWDPKTQEYTKKPITGVEPMEFDNVPTEGFVLNKKAGGTNSGWNHRQTYCRVYDPRGFEFEITIPNLLFILEECSAYKGKGLEGEFVYSWDGKDLVLLPTSASDYKECVKFTSLQSQKVGKKDLVEGCTYLTSKMDKLIYLGQHLINEDTYYTKTKIEIDYSGNGRNGSFELKHVFRPIGELKSYYPYEFLNSFSKLKAKVSDDIDPLFPEYIDELQKSEFYAEPDHLEIEPITTVNNRDIFDNYSTNVYKFGEVNSVPGLQTLKRYMTRSIIVDGMWDVSIEKQVKSSSYWGGYNTAYEPEGTFTKEEVKQNYGMLVRVYKNGFKKLL